MPKRKGKKRAGEEYLLLYHLSRAGIIPKTDLSLCRGNLDDRYAQRIIVKNIKQGHIATIHYRQCCYCFITNKGVEFLRELEGDVFNRSGPLDEYQNFLQNNPQNQLVKETINLQGESKNILLWKPRERMSTKPMNSQRRIKLERLADGSHSDKLKAEIRHSGANNILYSSGVVVYEEDKPDYKTFLSILNQFPHRH